MGARNLRLAFNLGDCSVNPCQFAARTQAESLSSQNPSGRHLSERRAALVEEMYSPELSAHVLRIPKQSLREYSEVLRGFLVRARLQSCRK